jgi:hypothetical protein
MKKPSFTFNLNGMHFAFLLLLLAFTAFHVSSATASTSALTNSAIQNTALQADDSLASTQEVSATTPPEAEGKPFWQSLKETLIALFFLTFFVGASIYMYQELRRVYYVPITLAQVLEKRKSLNMTDDSTDEEDANTNHFLESVFNDWSVISAAGEEELRAPRKRVHVQNACRKLEEAKNHLSTDPVLIERINELGEVLNHNAKRRYTGSNKLLIVAGLITAFFILIMGNETFGDYVRNFLNMWFIWGAAIFYFFASYAPQFLIEKREKRFGNANITSGVIGFFTAMFFSAPAYDTITHWSDGSKTKETNINWITLIIMIFALIIIGTMIFVFGMLNFIRNYVLYA